MLFFSPDGNTLIPSGGAMSIQWDLGLGLWKARACRVANRNLTRAEWRQYLGDEPYSVLCPDCPVPDAAR